MKAEYENILQGKQETSLGIFASIMAILEDIESFPDLLEPIYREAAVLDEESLDYLRFALLRLQVYADIHRNENMEEAQNLKYVGQVLEKIIYGSLMLEKEEPQD
ncbi:MAG: hypothetical protein LUO93_01990 [Methanomicrobiales archaeon]|nr:hypothetical protein [Methanomicrobiales archaeon]